MNTNDSQNAAETASDPIRTEAEEVLNPHNVFQNPTEFWHYHQDYREINPSVGEPGFRLPLEPDYRERRKIRHYYNLTGTVMLGHMFLSNVFAVIFLLLYYAIQTAIDTARMGGELPVNYDYLLEEFFYASSANTALNVIVFMLCNVGAAIIGCKWARIPIPSLFQTKGFTPGLMLIYICAAIALQSGTGYLSSWISDFLSQAGITAYEPDFSTGQDLKNVILMSIYGCIVAPITEELLFRGFVMKSLSRVSQRFAIITSALLFGLWHENIAQFVLAFCVGVFMGYLTVKHNSIMPAIICHMAVNTAAQIFDIAYTYDWYILYAVMDYLYMGISFIGAVLLIRMLIRERLPQTTPHQAERGLRIAMSSFPLILAILAHLVATIMWISEASA